MDDVNVSDVMTNLVVMMKPNDSLQAAASRLIRNGVSGAPVVEEGKVIGVLSSIDIQRAVAGRGSERGVRTSDLLSVMWRGLPVPTEGSGCVADAMSTPVISIGPDATLRQAAETLDRHGIKRLPVLERDGYLIGIISRGDLVRAMRTERRPATLASP